METSKWQDCQHSLEFFLQKLASEDLYSPVLLVSPFSNSTPGPNTSTVDIHMYIEAISFMLFCEWSHLYMCRSSYGPAWKFCIFKKLIRIYYDDRCIFFWWHNNWKKLNVDPIPPHPTAPFSCFHHVVVLADQLRADLFHFNANQCTL